MGKAGTNPRGPAPTPTALKVLRGTDRADRKAPNEVKFEAPSIIPKAPAYFDKPAKDVWLKTTRTLQDLKMLAEVDYEMLAAFCFQTSIMERCAKKLAKPNGLIVVFTNKYGAKNSVANPLIKIYNDALSNVNRLAQQFGFSPSARTRITAPTKEDGDGFDSY